MVDFTVRYILQEEVLEELARKVHAAQERQNDTASEIAFYEKKLADNKKSIANVLRAIESGAATQTLPARLQELENEQAVILGEIKKLFRDGGTVKVSRSLKELSLRINAAREHHSKLCGAEPTLSQLAEELGESVENITLAIQAAQPALSLTPENREEGDRQMDIPVESPEEELADKIGLAEVLKSLPEEDRLIIQLRFYGGKTQSDTAKLLHTTQVQISRRERKILKVMRDRLLDE